MAHPNCVRVCFYDILIVNISCGAQHVAIHTYNTKCQNTGFKYFGISLYVCVCVSDMKPVNTHTHTFGVIYRFLHLLTKAEASTAKTAGECARNTRRWIIHHFGFYPRFFFF